jgi:chromosome segregation ATPase
MWFVTARRHDDELAAAKSEIRRQRERAEAAEERARTAEFNREQILRQLAEADAANRRLHDRNLELGRRVTALAESDMDYAAQLERRVARLKKVGKRIVAAWWRERRRAERLQERLDDAAGLSTTIVDSGRWQPGYKPAPKPEVAP